MVLPSFLVILLVRRFGIRLVHVFFPPEKLESIRFLKSSPKRTILFLLIFSTLVSFFLSGHITQWLMKRKETRHD